ncbi:MAG: hypothetical protein HDQ96_00290 [Lachnospiraceae bacterium]|nr:hypothetical protein [Lachnospiraceae bacterium]
MRKYHYLVLFLIGYLVLWPFILHKLYIEEKKNTEVFEELPVPEKEELPVMADVSETVSDNDTVSGSDTVSESETVSGNEAEEDSEDMEEELPPELFFQDTLFIGDSRTMGLVEYADLNNAVVFANTGMNIYRLYSTKNAVRGQEAYLEDILAERQYRKIYLMLGINELGYDEAKTVERFEEEIVNLRELQPDAKIILEANLHVTAARSERDDIFNNENIDRINDNIRQIAEKYELDYIDVNEIFDDESGGLNPEYTHDNVHVLGKYYQQWADWIRENGI